LVSENTPSELIVKKVFTYIYSMDKENVEIRELAEGLTNQLYCYVKERNKIGQFETSDLYSADDLKIHKVDVGIEVNDQGYIRVWTFIIFMNEGTLKDTLFHGNEKKLRTWVESIKGGKWMFEYFVDTLKR
jgi:hypothetical protein